MTGATIRPDRERPGAGATTPEMDPERLRLAEARDKLAPWYAWGPYLAERAWGTVREDYSADGDAWRYFPHDQARSRAYRWSEDGLLGISDEHGKLCFALALWNGADPILKERLFGLSGPEGNHGEDVKEYYFYLDATPTHSYLKALYKYPQRPFPYEDLVRVNQRRGRLDPEYELIDSGAFAEDRYFDVVVEYAKAAPDDIVICIAATNRGPDPAPLHLLPTLWYRNTWAWGWDDARGELRAAGEGDATSGAVVHAKHPEMSEYWLACAGAPTLLFTENETNTQRLWGLPNTTPYVKDGINEAIVDGAVGAVNAAGVGTKMAAHYQRMIAAGATERVVLRLSARRHPAPFAEAEDILAARRAEADAFYAGAQPATVTPDEALVQRQAFAGMIWSKQFYHWNVQKWLDGDPRGPTPPLGHRTVRDTSWVHVNPADVMSMPDTWEYPWFAAWDLAFHCIPLALIDPEFAKRQLLLLLREWFMHPNGQIPAYEWAFGDVNPPVHAWAAFRVYQIDRRITGQADRVFLEAIFHKLLLNFTWWVNRQDSAGRNIFQGGFLGLDNIGAFDRSAMIPDGGILEQSDSTAWMAMYCLNMGTIAIELAREEPIYQDMANKFLEHFLYIVAAMNNVGNQGISLWDETDQFFYDVLCLPDGTTTPLRVRSVVGLLPLLAVETVGPHLLHDMPAFRERFEWVLKQRPQLANLIVRWGETGRSDYHLLAIGRGAKSESDRQLPLIRRMLDPNEFLSDFGIRALSKYHQEHPYILRLDGSEYSVDYEPAESTSGLFGGNSNWRGPIWFPINFLLIEALQRYGHFYGDELQVEYPTGSGQRQNLWDISNDVSRRLTSIFLRDGNGRRPVFGGNEYFQTDPHWRDYIPFHEYFHGDNGAGLGASHQTGWTGLVAKLIDQTARFSKRT